MLATFGGFWDTWNTLFKVSFSGQDRLIYINKDSIDINVQQDLYSAWKFWSKFQEANNLSFSQAFRTFGGDKTTEGQVAPQYFFLMNGWRVVVDNQHINLATNLYSDDYPNPFIQLNGGTVSNKTADVPVVSTTSSGQEYNGITAKEVWEYNNRELTSKIDFPDCPIVPSIEEINTTLESHRNTIKNDFQNALGSALGSASENTIEAINNITNITSEQEKELQSIKQILEDDIISLINNKGTSIHDKMNMINSLLIQATEKTKQKAVVIT